MYKKIIVFICFFSLLFISVSNAQKYLDKPKDNRQSFGLFLGVGQNIHTADFIGVDFPQVPSCCPRYESGSGFGYNLGLLYDIPLSNNLTLTFRGIYQNLSGTLSTLEPTVVSDPNGNATDGSFEHSVDGTLTSIGLLPMIGYRFLTDCLFLSVSMPHI